MLHFGISANVYAVLLMMLLNSLYPVNRVHGLTCFCTIGECSDSKTWPKERCQATPPITLFESYIPKMKTRILNEVQSWGGGNDAAYRNTFHKIVKRFKTKLSNQSPHKILILYHGLVYLANEQNRLRRLGMSEKEIEDNTVWRKQEIVDLNVTMNQGYYKQFCLKMLEPDGTTSKGCGHYITQVTGLDFAEGCHKQVNPKVGYKNVHASYCRCSGDKCNWGNLLGNESENMQQVAQIERRSASAVEKVSASLAVFLVSTVAALVLQS